MNIVLNFPQTIDICSCFAYTISIIIKSLVLIVSFPETDKEQEPNEMNGIKEECEVEMDSDFTGEVEEACSCVIGHCQSSILSYYASKEILKVIEAVNSYRLKGN